MLPSVLAQEYYNSGNAAANGVSWALALAGVGLCIFVLYDALRRPDWVWPASGQSKTLWTVLGIVGIFPGCCCGLVGVIIGAVYLASIRSKLDAVQNSGGYGGGPGYGPPPGPGGYGPPPGPSGYNPPQGYNPPSGSPGFGPPPGSPGYGPPPGSPGTSFPPPGGPGTSYPPPSAPGTSYPPPPPGPGTSYPPPAGPGSSPPPSDGPPDAGWPPNPPR
jgi:hypothetical protein